MLDLLDASIEAFLRAEVPLSPRQVEISFEAPDRDWGASVNKPTVNAFLWDVRNNFAVRQAGVELVEEPDGRRMRRPPKPRVDFRYLVTAWTKEIRDEHQLLGAVLATLLRHREMPEGYLQGAYASIVPLPTITVAQPDGRQSTDFWSALGGRLKPGLDLVLTATIDVAASTEAGPPVERYEVALEDRRDPGRASRTGAVGGVVVEGKAGAVVRSPRGHGTVDAKGRFVVPAIEGDEIVVEK